MNTRKSSDISTKARTLAGISASTPKQSWTFKLKNAGNGFIVSEDDGNICDVFMTNDPAIAERRAHLITCAPGLYQACEVGFTALWAIKARLGEARTDAEKAAIDELQRRMDILSSALRKARGEK